MIEYVVESGGQVSDKVVPKGASRRVLKEPCGARGVHCGLERKKGSREADRGPSTEVRVCACGCLCVRACLSLLLPRTCCAARE